MKSLPRVYADFNKADGPNTVILTAAQTVADLKALGFELLGGQRVLLYMPDVDDEGKSDPLEVEATLRRDEKKGWWVADFDWKQLDHISRKRDK